MEKCKLKKVNCILKTDKEIFAFYWIQKSGISRFTWYNDVESKNKRESKDELMSGFFVAIVNFSKELFNNQMAHIDVNQYEVFFSYLENSDILVLVTLKGFSPYISESILAELKLNISCKDLEDNSCMSLEDDKVLPILKNAFEKIIPKSFEKTISKLMHMHFEDENLMGYLLVENNGNVLRKEMKPDLDFESQTFMESLFWDKNTLLNNELRDMAEKSLNIKKLYFQIIKTPSSIINIVFLPSGIISECYKLETKLKNIESANNGILALF